MAFKTWDELAREAGMAPPNTPMHEPPSITLNVETGNTISYQQPIEERKTIWVKFTAEGIHRYPEAGTNPALADVSFLAFPHRHIFHFEVGVQVIGDNRDIEFIQFKRWLQGLYSGKVLDLDFKSCEMIGKDILEKVFEKYPNVKYAYAIVSEDGENGANIQRRR